MLTRARAASRSRSAPRMSKQPWRESAAHARADLVRLADLVHSGPEATRLTSARETFDRYHAAVIAEQAALLAAPGPAPVLVDSLRMPAPGFVQGLKRVHGSDTLPAPDPTSPVGLVGALPEADAPCAGFEVDPGVGAEQVGQAA